MEQGFFAYQKYTRKEVHDILDPQSKYTPQAGSWGLSGIVHVPYAEKEYVFFVTFGMKQGLHKFDESITIDGVLTWQSQPKNTFKTKHIQHFIHHDHDIANIYLF
jgi:hypothetical protein